MTESRTICRLDKPVSEGAPLFIPTDKGVEGIRDIAKWLLPRPGSFFPIDRHAVIYDKDLMVGTHIGSLEVRENLWVGEISEITEEVVTVSCLRRLFEKE